MRRALVTLLMTLAVAAPAAAACTEEQAFDPAIPTWEAVNGFELGSRRASYDEVLAYVDELALRTDRVMGADLGRESWRGRRLPYLIVSSAPNLTRLRLPEIAGTMRAMRRGELASADIVGAANTLPAIVAVAANVHGDEPSGTDASMRLLYELAARTDCANEKRLDNLLTLIMPLQNPDGRISAVRGNSYRFDLNRDWFARTQPETDAKVALLRRYPPIAFVDAHEQAGDSYFFPPNADPIHHEISSEALTAIATTYAPALADAAEREGFDYFTHATYDLFFMGYGDTAPSTAFGAAGMTFEKGDESPYPERTAEQFATQDATVTAAAEHKAALLEQWGDGWRHAASEGRRGVLEPNVVVQPGNEVQFPVPQVKVFGYFLRTDSSRGDAARLARRLRAFDVRVYRLTEPARLHGARRYGERRFRTEKVPEGTFWIPMGQAQKHGIQALLAEDPYVPFPYFYDVSSWSNPLLMGLEGGFVSRRARPRAELWNGGSLGGISGPGPAWRFRDDSSEAIGLIVDLLRAKARVIRSRTGSIATGIGRRRAERLARARDVVLRTFDATPPPRHSVDLRTPKVAILDDYEASGSGTGFAKFVADQRFGVDTRVVSAAELNGGALEDEDFTALVVPGAVAEFPDVAEVQRFVRRGGRYVGFGRAGLLFATAAGLTLTTAAPPPADYQVPGNSFRMAVDRVEPLGWGFFARESWLFNAGDPLLSADLATGTVAASYPSDGRFFAAGYTEGADALKGRPVAISQEIGEGQSMLFAFDPNFRAYTESTIRMFGNAILHPVAGQGAKGGFRVGLRPGLLERPPVPGPDAVIRVPLAAEALLRTAVLGLGLPPGARITRDLRGVALRVPSDGEAEELGWPVRVLERLRRADVRPNLVIL